MKKEIIYLFLINLVCPFFYSLIAPLFPYLANQKGINESIIGLIIAMSPICNIIITPFCPFILKKIGRKNIFLIALVSEAVSNLMFACVEYISSKSFLIVFSIFFRGIMGFSSSFINILTNSLAISYSDPNESLETLGFMELAYGFGLSTGPVFASILFRIGGFKLPFIFFSVLRLITIILVCKIEIIQSTNKDEEIKGSGIIQFMLNPLNSLICLTFVSHFISTTFFHPTLSIFMLTKYAMKVEYSSYLFFLGMILYLICLKKINFIVDMLGLKLAVLFGIFLNLCTSLTFAPAIFLPQTYITTIFGLLLMGIPTAIILIPGVKIIANNIKSFNEDENTANDISLTLWNFGMNLGDALGPILGGFITNNYSFEASSYAVLLMNGTWLLIFFVYNKNDLIQNITEFKDNWFEKNDLINNLLDKTKEKRTKQIKLVEFPNKNKIYSDEIIENSEIK